MVSTEKILKKKWLFDQTCCCAFCQEPQQYIKKNYKTQQLGFFPHFPSLLSTLYSLNLTRTFLSQPLNLSTFSLSHLSQSLFISSSSTFASRHLSNGATRRSRSQPLFISSSSTFASCQPSNGATRRNRRDQIVRRPQATPIRRLWRVPSSVFCFLFFIF